MSETPNGPPMVGLFWIVDGQSQAMVVGKAVPLGQAVPYGDMLTIDTGHLELWSELSSRGAAGLRAASLPTAPLWSEYEEWPRGRVLYNQVSQRFIIRGDRQLRVPALLRLITDHFRITGLDVQLVSDDHYLSIRRVSAP